MDARTLAGLTFNFVFSSRPTSPGVPAVGHFQMGLVVAQGESWLRQASPAVMGFAIASMRCAGTAPPSDFAFPLTKDVSHAISVSSLGATGIAVVTFTVLALAALTFLAGRRDPSARRLVRPLTHVFFAVMGGMAAYEGLKMLAYPHVTIWASHLMTIGASSVAAVVAAYFVLQRQSRLLERAVLELRDRKRAEQELRRVDRALRTISACNQVLVRAEEESHLLDDICGTLVREGGYRMAWVGFAEHDEGKSVRPATHAGFEDGYLQTARISWADTERGRGPTGTAIRTGKPVVARFIHHDPRLAPWREDALKRGYASSAALPILVNEQTLGALTVYAQEPEAFDSEEMQLLAELSRDLAYGIQALRTRAERKQAEAASQAAEQRLADIIEFLPDATFVIDQDQRLIAWNQACEVMTGVKKQALLGQGDYAYAEPFFGERRPLLIDLVHLPSQELEATYKYVQRKGGIIFGEIFIPRLNGGQGAHLWGVASCLFDREGRRYGAIEPFGT